MNAMGDWSAWAVVQRQPSGSSEPRVKQEWITCGQVVLSSTVSGMLLDHWIWSLAIVPGLFLQFGGTVVLLRVMEEVGARVLVRLVPRWRWQRSERFVWFGGRTGKLPGRAGLVQEQRWILLAQAAVACALAFGLLGRWMSSLPFLPGVVLGIGGIVTASLVTEVATEWACERWGQRELRVP